MQHELGTSAVLEAGFTRRRRHRHRADVDPAPVDRLPDRRRQLVLPHPRRGPRTHCGNRALAIRPGGPGDAIGVNALEKAVKIVVALQELEQQWGLTKSHPYFMPGFFSLLPGRVPLPTRGSTSRSTSHIVPRSTTRLWYPPTRRQTT